jgi:cold shock protein
MATNTEDVLLSTESTLYLGQVKWFNTKSGYGFITITDGSRQGTDIFAHHSAIVVTGEQYRYLVQGEYVEFTLAPTEGSAHAEQASQIRGIKGGKLMCETRHDLRNARVSYRQQVQSSQSRETTDPLPTPRVSDLPESLPVPKKRAAPKASEEEGEWTSVTKAQKRLSSSNQNRKQPAADKKPRRSAKKQPAESLP